MNKQIIDELLSAMIRSGEGISDLLFTVGKPRLIEAHGCLSEFPIKTPATVFGSGDIDQLVDHIINGDERLRGDLANWVRAIAVTRSKISPDFASTFSGRTAAMQS